MTKLDWPKYVLALVPCGTVGLFCVRNLCICYEIEVEWNSLSSHIVPALSMLYVHRTPHSYATVYYTQLYTHSFFCVHFIWWLWLWADCENRIADFVSENALRYDALHRTMRALKIHICIFFNLYRTYLLRWFNYLFHQCENGRKKTFFFAWVKLHNLGKMRNEKNEKKERFACTSCYVNATV